MFPTMYEGLSDQDKAHYLRTLFDTIPLPTFVVDADVVIQDYNAAAAAMLGPNPERVLHQRGGDAWHCVGAGSRGCGHGLHCGTCVVRSSVRRAMLGSASHRQMHKAELRTPSGTASVNMLITTAPLKYNGASHVLLMLEDVSELVTLRGLLPICSSCKKIRDDGGAWNQIEHYIRERSEAKFSHSLCPDCAKTLYPEYYDQLMASLGKAKCS
jgi:PAS domain-containing protein